MRCLTILVVFHLMWNATARFNDMDALIAKANIYSHGSASVFPGARRDLVMADIAKLTTKKAIKLIIHGYLASRTDKSIRPLTHAYLANGAANVFLADWSDAAAVDYRSARRAVGAVAMHLAKILKEFLKRFEIADAEVHLLGHSLGAHIVGGIGKYFNGSLGRITGLDPALPLFTPHSKDGLSGTSAQFVDVIHTDFPVFGDITPRGSIDFYPHFGLTPQPGCGEFDPSAFNKLIFQSYSCSHQRAVNLYAESIILPRNFPALPCPLNNNKLLGVTACLRKIQDAGFGVNSGAFAAAIAKANKRDIVFMGENVSKTARGFYFLQTYDAPPYGIRSYLEL